MQTSTMLGVLQDQLEALSQHEDAGVRAVMNMAFADKLVETVDEHLQTLEGGATIMSARMMYRDRDDPALLGYSMELDLAPAENLEC